jgi:serine/threonine protein phosphatase PrpC
MRQHLRRAVQITGVSDIGRCRSRNEDSIRWDEEFGIITLADGMGGAKAGEVASGIVAETMLTGVREEIRSLRTGLEEVVAGEGYRRGTLLLRDALSRANNLVRRIVESQPQYSGMGTTSTTLLFYDNMVSVCHVGDSRLYLLRDSSLQQMTEDHTVVQDMVRGGFYTKEQGQESEIKNIVTRAVGIADELQEDLLEEDLEPEDILIVCSDGLTDMVDDSQIEKLLLEDADLSSSAQGLIDLANESGGKDNVSVILARIVSAYPSKRSLGQVIWDWFF